MGVIAQLLYSCVHNQIATFGLLGRQSVTLNIGCSHNRNNQPSEQSAKCNIGQALVLYCIVSIYLYSASCSAHQSQVLPVQKTQREESSLERTKKCTWLTS